MKSLVTAVAVFCCLVIGSSIATYAVFHPDVVTRLGVTLSSVTLMPTEVEGSNSSTGTVLLTGPAPTGGMVVNLSSSNSSAIVPASVTVPAGSSSATFSIATTAVSSSLSASIKGTQGT